MAASTFPDWVRPLVRAACCAPSADNSQPWRFVWDGRGLTLWLDAERGASGLGADHPGNLLAIGAANENLAQAAAAIGLPTDALRFGRDRDGDPYAAVEWSGSVRLPEDEAKLPLYGRHTNRGPYSKTPLHPAVQAEAASMKEGRTTTRVYSDPADVRRMVKLVRDASAARFQTEEIHRWLGRSLRFTPAEVERGDGLDVATLMLPPGAMALLRFSLDWPRMAAMNRLGAYKLFAGLEAAMLTRSAALVAVVGPAEQCGDILAAGRLMERLWIALNAAGLAVHPYFVLTDQLYRLRSNRVPAELRPAVEAIAGDVAALLGSSESTIWMLLRVGHPKVANPVRSRRLPIEATLTIRDR